MTEEIAPALLQEIKRWRESLARNIALRNPALSQHALNVAVQGLINRLLCLRLCEARGLEPDGQLRAWQEDDQLYRRLGQLFDQVDDRYRGGLFHFNLEKERTETAGNLSLIIDDDVIKEILKNLYAPHDQFSDLPVDVLGRVYEQGLGQVIRLTPTRRIVIEDKPALKKAGGVYYTPTYIVDYIVQQTVGQLLTGRKPGPGGPVSQLKILDPACGSGLFLLGVYQFLLDWYRDQYLADDPQWASGPTPRLYQGRDGQWRLTLAERRRILLNHLYGLDVDPQAVEVSRLSLLLKMLEDEPGERAGQPQPAVRRPLLLELGHNIKWGNALIGPDFYQDQPMNFLAETEGEEIHAFDWAAEFPEIMAGGGFEVVIGNPPYIDSEWMSQYLPHWRRYCAARYQTASGNWDIFCVFIEKAFELCKPGGLTGMIVPNKLGSAGYAVGARRVLATENRLISIRDYAHVPVFSEAIYPIVYVAQKRPPQPGDSVKYERMARLAGHTVVCSQTQTLDYERYFVEADRPWPIFANIRQADLIERLQKQFPPLSSVAEVWGAATVAEAYALQPLIQECPDQDTAGLKVVNSGTIDRYHTWWGQKKLRYLGHSYLRPVIPAHQKKHLPKKRKQQAAQPKIIMAGLTKCLEGALDLGGTILAGKSTSIIFSTLNLKYLLGLLNSQLFTFYYHTVFGGNKLQGEYLRIGPPQLRQLPIRPIDFSDPTDKADHDRLVELVEQMLARHEQLAQTKEPQAKTVLQRQIEATDRQIDRLVYVLYGLSEEEIKVVTKPDPKGLENL